MYLVPIRCCGIYQHPSSCSVGYIMEIVPLSINLMPSGIHMTAGAVTFCMEIIPLSIQRNPANCHRAVCIEIIPVIGAIPVYVLPAGSRCHAAGGLKGPLTITAPLFPVAGAALPPLLALLLLGRLGLCGFSLSS